MSVLKFNEYNSEQVKESKFTKIAKTLKGFANVKTVGIMTAENPMGEESTPLANKAAMNSLKELLKAKGYGFRDIIGRYGNWEHSIIINDITREDIMELNATFLQKGCIYGERLEEGGFKFEYWERSTEEAPMELLDTRYDVKTNPSSDREDLFTQTAPKATKDPRRFYIPFFDDSEGGEEEKI